MELILKNQKISEPLIEKYQGKLQNYWFYISQHQELSESFIEKHKDDVCWDYIFNFQHLSADFIEKYKYEVDLNHINIGNLITNSK